MANIIASGDWWRFEDDGTLYVYCTGDMPYDEWTPWLGYYADILSVVIQDGVTDIGDSAFADYENLASVTIGSGVIAIKEAAFNNCIALTSVTIPSSVVSVGDNAFTGCEALTAITIPDSVTNIGNLAFYGCTSLSSAIIPSSVTSIGGGVFQECTSLTSVTIPDPGSADYSWDDVFQDTELNITSLTISDGVSSIGDHAFAFAHLANNATVTIPNSVSSIGDGAFENSYGLTSVVFGNGVTSIGDSAFASCATLTAITIPDSVTSIGNSAFANCAALTSATIPGSVTSIGSNVFANCSSLTDIAMPNGVTSIGESAFEGCVALTSVTIASSVASIGWCAFQYCDNLTDVYYSGTETQWNAVEIDISNYALENATIHYTEPVLTSITITTPPTKTAYTVGELFDPSGMVVSAAYSDGNTAEVTGYDYKETPLTAADTSLVVGYSENGVYASATVAITVTEPEPEPVPAPNRIYVRVKKQNGAILLFGPSTIKQLDYTLSTSMDGRDVQADVFTAIVQDDPTNWMLRWRGVNMSCPVFLTIGTRTEKYYYKSITRIGKTDFELSAQSPLGRLTDDYPGNLYSAPGGLYPAAPLPDVIAAIIGGVVPDYSVNPLLESVKVYGWIPYQDRRTTLHQLALAYGFLIRRNDNHDLYFTVPDTSAYNIPDSAIFTGGSVAYRFGETYARADITAYDFRETDTESITLYDNAGGVPADNLLVRFESPVFSLHADDTLTVHKAGVNYAIVSGSGQLTGKPYAKIASVVSVDGDPDADPQHVLSVSDVPVITSLNAVAVGERLLSYYNAPAVVNADIIHTSQRPGDCVEFTDPFGDPQTGYITELSGSVSSLDRASAAVVCGYAPSWGSAFDTLDVLTGSGSWTVPASLDGTKIRVVLIGGGQGGASGQHGTDSRAVGSGRGLPGVGGNVLDVKFTAVAGQTYQYKAGTGGWGGSDTDDISTSRPDNMTVYITRTGDRWHLNPNCNGGTYTPTTLKKALEKHLTPCENCVKDSAAYYISNPGSNGTASTFGDYSSDDGHPTNTGFFDVLYGTMYAAPGADNGIDGGSATTGKESGDKTNPNYNDVQRFSVSDWISGTPGTGWVERDGDVYDYAYGGLGGGAAVGNDGEPGQNGRFSAYVEGGGGGKGADALAIFPADMSYGSGGSGGHGGGEGGKGGSATAESGYQAEPGADGVGGRGTGGQDGADGCILIYYKKPNELQYSFSVRDGELILTYYTDTPPRFSLDNNGKLVFSYDDGETPPTFEIRNGVLYKLE